MIQLLAKNSTHRIIRIAGFSFLAIYLFFSRDFSFSIVWALIYVVIGFLLAWLIAKSKLADRFPKLNSYYFFHANKNSETKRLTENEWVVRKAAFLESGIKVHMVLYAVSEDGLICVPVLLVGINPVTAIVGGLAFGFLHLWRFTYLECIGKAIIYSFVCLFILPHGILTVIAGHLMADFLALVSLRLIKKKLS